MSQVWVIGQGGLLGSALLRLLQQEGQVPFAVDQPWQWSSPEHLGIQMQDQTRRFARQLVAGESWTIYWAAGQGNLHSREEDFNAEDTALRTLLTAVNTEPALLAGEGRIALASSAGAVYAGCLDQPISERSVDSPTTPYGRAKLSNEAALIAWAGSRDPLSHAGRHAFIGRLSTLYGPGQAWGKQQGLISHLARQLLRNKPLHIYVPLGTQRDYLHVDDAAWALVEGARHMRANVALHIIASQQATTVAEILRIFTRLMRRSPRIVTSAAAAGSVYRQQMTFRSEQPIRPPRGHGLTPLHIGIHQVLQAERTALANGNPPKVNASA
jgi:UDP-glucose 4-epimerase